MLQRHEIIASLRNPGAANEGPAPHQLVQILLKGMIGNAAAVSLSEKQRSRLVSEGAPS